MGKGIKGKKRDKALAEVWEDRDGKARPTPERKARGKFVLRDTDTAGVTVAVDEHSTLLDYLADAGAITDDQRQGGLDFAALMRRTQLVSEGRSCIDFSPVGHDPEEYDDTQDIADGKARRELYRRCGPRTWHILRRACVENAPGVSVERLKTGLDECADFFGCGPRKKRVA